MASDWPLVPLGSLVDSSRGISYGIVQPGAPVADGVPIIRAGDLRGDRIDLSSPLRVSHEIEQNYARTRLRGGELVMSIVGTVGQTAIVDKTLAGWNTARAVAVIPVRPEVGARWIKLCLKTPAALALINSRLNTTVQATLNLRDIIEIPIPLPPASVRDSIVLVLASLEEKLQSNRKLSATLTSVMQTTFQDWFVDFGPTKAKSSSQLPYLSAELWSMFPNQIGIDGIPQGWRYSSIGKEVTVNGGSTPNTKNPSFWGGDIAWATPKDLSALSAPVLLNTERKITEAGLEQIGSGLLPEGTVLLSSRAPIGYLAVAQIATAVNQGFIAMTCEKDLSNIFTWLWTMHSMESIKSKANGSTFQEISKSNFRPIQVVLPTPKILKAFDFFTQPSFNEIVANEKENRLLNDTRDFLLPKLMSGRIRVRDAETLVGKVL